MKQINFLLTFVVLLSFIPVSLAHYTHDDSIHSQVEYYEDDYTLKYSAPFSSTEKVLRDEIDGTAFVPTKDADKTSCELVTGLQNRIQCRLEAGTENTGLFEACKALEFPLDQQECVRMFISVDKCFDFVGSVKDMCFRERAGYVDSVYGTVVYDDSVQKAYTLFLLLDAQGTVEEQYEKGKISSQDASLQIYHIIREQQRILIR